MTFSAMATYMQTHLPITNSVLKQCHYLCPVARKSKVEEDLPEEKLSLKRGLVYLARQFQRFNPEETEVLDNKIAVYLSLSEVPQFNFSDRVDDWWIKILSLISDKSGDILILRRG